MSGQSKATQIKIIYPVNGHQTYEASTFVMGQVLNDTGETLNLKLDGSQDEMVAVSAQGYFSHPAPLRVGQNRLTLALAQKNGQPLTASVSVNRKGPLTILSQSSLEVHLATLGPARRVALCPGQFFELSFSASPETEITLEIPGILKTPILISPLFPDATTETAGIIDNREPLFQELHQLKQPIPKAGWYYVKIPVPPDTRPIADAPMKLHLKNGRRRHDIQLPMTCSVWDAPKRATIKMDKGDGAVIRTSPPEGERKTPLYGGAELWIDALIDDWARLRLSPQDSAWVNVEDIDWHLHKSHAEPPYVLLGDVRYSTTGEGRCGISLSSAYHLPLQLEASVGRLDLTLYGATSNLSDGLILPELNELTLRQIELRQARESVVSLETLLLRENKISGFDYRYTQKGTEILFRTLPQKSSEIKIVLDPGHGGSEFGSVGLSGLPEKTLNLTMAKKLQQALLTAGFGDVLLTRESDIELTLTERGAFVRKHQPHIVLSLHHNALPDGRDPRAHEGACCFYYHEFSKPLAEALQQGLVRQAGAKDYGVFHESFYMTRIPQAMAVLVEFGFFTNPAEFERLTDPAYQDKEVNALAECLSLFL